MQNPPAILLDEHRSGSPLSDPWPFCHPQWPIRDIWAVRIALAKGGVVHPEAVGVLCSHCGGGIDQYAECMTHIDAQNRIWPIVICNSCRGEIRADAAFALRIEESIDRRFGARLTDTHSAGGRA